MYRYGYSLHAQLISWDTTLKMLRLLLATVFICIQCSNFGYASSSDRLSVMFLSGQCEGQGFGSEEQLEEAVRMATEDISACSGLLHGAELTLTTVGAYNDLEAVLGALQPAESRPRHLAAVYPGCNEDANVLAELTSTSVFQLLLLSYQFPSLPSSSLLFPYHFHMTSSEAHLPAATVTTIRHFGWQRVAVITENKPVFTAGTLHTKSFTEVLVKGLQDSNVTVTHQIVLFSRDGLPDSQTLFGEDVKIFILNMFPDMARSVLCQALQTLRYPGYIWITPGWYREEWWEEGADNGCSGEQLAEFLEGSLAVSHLPMVEEGGGEILTGSGKEQPCQKSPNDFASDYYQQTSPSSYLPNDTLPGSTESGGPPLSAYLVYDAVWAAALAYSSAHSAPGSLLEEAMGQLNFTGVSGLVSFSNGTRDGTYLTLVQYREVRGVLQEVPVALLSPSGAGLSYLEGEGLASVWPEGVPGDGTPIEVEHFPFPALMGIVYTYCCLGVVFAVGCLIFNIIYRKRKLIRLNSPNLNNIIVLGGIVLYLSGLTFFYPEGASVTGITWGCNLRAWSVALGFSICYGTINVKMWRVFIICRRPKPTMKKTFLKDWHLMLIVLLFVMVDTVILIVVMALDNSRFSVTIIPNKQDPTPRVNEDGIKEISVISRCHSSTEPYWLAVLFGYKIVIQVMGIIFAFKIRKVKIKGLNDSKEVSAILYITSVILAVILVVNFALGDYIDVDGFVYGFGVATIVTIVLLFTFVPKMVGLYKDPKGEHVFDGPTSVVTSDPSEMAFLQQRIKSLEKQVELAKSRENLTMSCNNLAIERTDSNYSSQTPPLTPPTSLPISPTSSNDTTISSSGAQALRSPTE